VAVSTYIVGLVGSSNNPISGTIIITLLLSGGMMVLFGVGGSAGILATLVVAGVVCCAAATAGDIAQNLKTGAIIKASPRAMQIIQIICIVIPSLILMPVLSQLHQAYGIGTGLKAPQAKMFAALSQMIFNPEANIPWMMIIIGIGIGIGLVVLDEILKRFTKGARAYVMAVAVGIYLPLSLAMPILVGGIVKRLRGRREEVAGSDQGTLFASGLIAGEAVMAIVLAIPIGMGWKGWTIFPSDIISLLFFGLGVFLLRRVSRK